MTEIPGDGRRQALKKDLRVVRNLAARAESEAKLLRLREEDDQAAAMEEQASVLRLLAYLAERDLNVFSPFAHMPPKVCEGLENMFYEPKLVRMPPPRKIDEEFLRQAGAAAGDGVSRMTADDEAIEPAGWEEEWGANLGSELDDD